MKRFNANLKKIRERVEEYLEFRAETGMVENSIGQKFWRGKLLVSPETWGGMMRAKLDVVLKHMPDEFVESPLPVIFDSYELTVSRYNVWIVDYIEYLAEVYHESPQAYYDRISVFNAT